MSDETVRFTVSLPRKLFDNMDKEVCDKSYQSRSEYIRDLFRERQVDHHWDNAQDEVIGVLTLIFDHHQRGLTEKLVEIQHDHSVFILCSTHVHISHNDCLETIIIRGNATEVNQLANSIGALKGVKLSRLTKAAQV